MLVVVLYRLILMIKNLLHNGSTATAVKKSSNELGSISAELQKGTGPYRCQVVAWATLLFNKRTATTVLIFVERVL
jgi:hypothetical protein